MFKEPKKRRPKAERIAEKQEALREKQLRANVFEANQRRMKIKNPSFVSPLDYCPVCLMVHTESPPDQCWITATECREKTGKYHSVYLHFQDYLIRKKFGKLE